jgi:hypothetical protein
MRRTYTVFIDFEKIYYKIPRNVMSRLWKDIKLRWTH